MVLSSGSIQTKQTLCQLNSQSSLTPSDTAPSTFVASLPWNIDGN
uniref:Uncharacterized protein n=1 Tax=Arundo donax TaxID=35708 RepID=A0A0A9GY44_ARUDO